MSICPKCDVKLLVSELPDETIVRCSNCGAVFGVVTMPWVAGQQTQLKPNTKANWSLICGIASAGTIIGLITVLVAKLARPNVPLGIFGTGLTCALGVAAVVFGVLALRDGRLPQIKPAAVKSISGIAMGGLFGVILGCCGILMTLVIPGIRPSSDPAVLAEAVEAIGKFEYPEGIEIDETQQVFGMRHLRCQDPAGASKIVLTLFPPGVAMNEAGARTQSVSTRAGVLAKLPSLNDRANYSVTCAGKDIEIREEFGSSDEAEFTVYSTYIENTNGWLFALIIVEDDGSTPAEPGESAAADAGDEKEEKKPRVVITRDQVKQFFRSYDPPEE